MQDRPPGDTIAAIATPRGRGGVSIIRISGPITREIGKNILGTVPTPRRTTHRVFVDSEGHAIDNGIAIYFQAPNSYTGEDVLELQGHGGPVVTDLLLKCALNFGARLARPGEFSERAFLNEKLDLAQAEAVADLIESHTEQAARCAMRSLQGEFSAHTQSLLNALVELRTYVEAALDFPEEEIDFLADETLISKLGGLKHQLRSLMDKAHQGNLLREGMHLVIAGRPNVGKSSLLNRLASQDAAIVSAIPGTTRDVMQQDIQLDGMPVRISDTAGLRTSTESIELEGIRRAWREINAADLILLLIDDQQGYGQQEREIEAKLPKGIPVLKVWNKIDLSLKTPGQLGQSMYISAKTGAGLDVLRQRLMSQMDYQGSSTEGMFMARRRHLHALKQTFDALGEAYERLRVQHAGELVAEELLNAQRALGQITGEFTSDDLLGKIFSSFCVGK